ncbi:unnamed protein product, partial [Brassica rapa subsp. trilocularis]
VLGQFLFVCNPGEHFLRHQKKKSIILDDVDDMKQLEVLATEAMVWSWK